MRKNIRYRLLVIVLALVIGYNIIFRGPTSGPIESVTTVEQGASRLSQLLGGDDSSAFARVLKSRAFDFPADHGPHPKYRNEWWYFTGNLDAVSGEQFGYELTIFRFSLALDTDSNAQSEWRSNQAFIGHLAISDIDREEFHVAQRYSRGSLGLAGTETSPLRVWVEDWSVEAVNVADMPLTEAKSANSFRLHASDGDIGLDLEVVAVKAPVLNGNDGLSQKSSEAGNASYYYSISRLQSDGTLSVAGVDYPVSGLSWLDREWSSSGLARDQIGWDWFALQLDDGSELMFYDLRKTDGTRDRHSAGTLIEKDGSRSELSFDDVTIDILEYWNSPRGGRYPAAWHLQIAKSGLNLELRPLLADQELMTSVRYWEGAVTVNGRRNDKIVGGRGYIELTGYAETGN